MVTRTVKFNIKQFIEDYRFFFETKDNESKVKLLEDFENHYKNLDYKVRVSVQTYLFNNDIAKQYPDLQAIATRCEANF